MVIGTSLSLAARIILNTCIYIYSYKKNQPSFVLIFSSRLFSWLASVSLITISSLNTWSNFLVDVSSTSIPLGFKVITVSLLSIAEVERFTHFFATSRSTILGTLEFFSIILPAISRTHICSGCLPLRMRKTLYCSCVRSKAFNSLPRTVLNHHAV
jgi:hypothetical protein